MSETISDSQFYMWRTIFAMAHVDHVVSNEEIRFMVEILEDIPFSVAQKETLTKDIAEPQDIVGMFESIEDPNDQAAFFNFARKMVWIDGDYGYQERDIMLKLKEIHVKNTNIDDLVGNVELEFEEEAPQTEFFEDKTAALKSFKAQFLKGFFKR